MNRVIHFLPEAEQEAYEAFRWYERQRPGLGLDFLLALDAAVRERASVPDSLDAPAGGVIRDPLQLPAA